MPSGCLGSGIGPPHNLTMPRRRNNSGRPGDRRNALFAHISGIRAELQRLPLLETSELLANELENPLVQSDARLRLRCLVVKGDVDLDMDTDLAKRDWTEARSLPRASVRRAGSIAPKESLPSSPFFREIMRRLR